MNKKISTRVGIITALLILMFLMVIHSMQLPANSPIIFIQFLFLFIGILASTFLLYKYYTDIKLIDAFKHCFRTLATIVVLMAIGNTILFFAFKKPSDPMSNLTIILGYTLFAYGLSGALSSFISSFIFNTFTKK